MKTLVKYLKISVLAIVSVLFFSCNKDIDVSSPFSLSDIEGTWMWTVIDGEFNTNLWIDVITAGGTDTCRFIEDDKWQEKVFSISVKNGIVSLSDHSDEFQIINVDQYTMVVENISSKKRMTAERAFEKDRSFLAGTWHADTYKLENITLNDYTVTYNEDGTYYVDYDGGETIQGRYFLLNNFLFYQSNRAGIIRIEVQLDEKGPQTNEVTLTSTGEIIVNHCRRVKGGPQITFEDINKTWITTTKDGEPIPLNDAAVCKGIDNYGHSIISYKENGTWVSKNVTLTLSNNIITRVIGSTTEDFAVLYFDEETIIWKNLSTGSVVTRKAIREPDKNKNTILGYWHDETSGDKVFFAEDSVFYESTDFELRAKYILYGDIVVVFNDEECQLFVADFGYDKERGERFAKWMVMIDNQIITYKYYKPDLNNKLAGGWIWTREDDVPVQTSDLEISYYNPITGMHDYQTFNDNIAKREIEPYLIEGRNILYPEDPELPYETILDINDSFLTVEGSDGVIYRATRIDMINPLKEQIIGEWNCQNFYDGNITNLTHIFDNNGLVTCYEKEGSNYYGTYQLYKWFLIMQFNNPTGIQTVLWVVKDMDIENGTMTFYRLLEDGSTLENILIKL